MDTISSVFGYVLNFIYNFIGNYGVAIILFSILLKIVLLPISIKQQKTMKKSAKIQGKVKELQEKYKNDQTKMNQEIMDLYKSEKMSPLSGCLSSIIQILLLFAMFGLVRAPLTHMKKIDADTINLYKTEMIEQLGDNSISNSYPEISIIKYVNENKSTEDPLYINTNFIGLDLSKVPQENMQDVKVYIIPVLYVLTTIISMRLSVSMTSNKKNNKKEDIIIEDGKEVEKNEKSPEEMTAQMTKGMSWFLPIMSISISIIAPLGLALYWLVNNILMIIERLVLNKFLNKEEEEQNG